MSRVECRLSDHISNTAMITGIGCAAITFIDNLVCDKLAHSEMTTGEIVKRSAYKAVTSFFLMFSLTTSLGILFDDEAFECVLGGDTQIGGLE